MTHRHLLVTALLTLLSLSGFAQSPIYGTDTSSRSRPLYSGQYTGVYDSGHVFFLNKSGALTPQKISMGNVVGLSAAFAGYYNAGKVDSLMSLRATVGALTTVSNNLATLNTDVANRATITQLNAANTRIDGVVAKNATQDDSIASKLTRAEFQAISSGLASTTSTYNQTEITGYLALKANASDVSLLSANTYTKTAVDGKLIAASTRDLAALGGLTLPTDSTVDARAAIQYAISIAGPTKTQFLPVGTYGVSGPIDIYAGKFIMPPGAKIVPLNDFATDPIAGNDGRYVIRVRAAGVILEGLNIDCKGKAVAPIALYFADDVTVRDCNLRNWRIGGLGQHGIAVLASKRARILNNTLFNGEHGINVFMSDGTITTGNFINVMVHGGIYCVFTSNFSSTDDYVFNCGDVGKDSEGGQNNFWTGGMTSRCKNGELAIFSGANVDSYISHHLIFDNCPAIREATYITMNATGTTTTTEACDAQYGATNIFGLDEGCYESGFQNCVINTTHGWAFWHNQLGDKSGRRIFFRNNKITASGGIYSALNSDGLSITDNIALGLAGSEDDENILRDMHNGTFSHNTIRYEVAKTTNYAVRFLTTSTWATIPFTVDHNTIINANTRAVQVDLFNNGSLVPTVWDNPLGTEYTTNGGLDITTNGRVRLVDQRLKLALASGSGGNNLAALPAFARMNGIGRGEGGITYGRIGFMGMIGRLSFVVKGDGNVDAYAETINPTAFWTMTATTNTGVVTLTTDQGALTGKADITVNSY